MYMGRYHLDSNGKSPSEVSWYVPHCDTEQDTLHAVLPLQFGLITMHNTDTEDHVVFWKQWHRDFPRGQFISRP